MQIPLKFGGYGPQGLFRMSSRMDGSLVEADLPSAKRKRGFSEVLPTLQPAAVLRVRIDLSGTELNGLCTGNVRAR